ncbi:uncharacterized protein LOC141612672 [Silene latifolia]|uniref:uncharacterized protein LOC141612672 n=1 Tax=Silene latifolia TaxID=37657 RepID=UPI003D77150B
MSPPQKPETPTPTTKPFTNLTDAAVIAAFFTYRYYVYSTTVHLIRPPQSHPNSRPWITARETTKDGPYILRHPLTSKPYSVTLPRNLHFSNLEPSILTNSYSFGTSGFVDKLLALKSPSYGSICVPDYTMFVLYGGGEMEGIARYVRVLDWVKTVKTTWPWIKLTQHRGEKFDDVVEFEGKVYVVDRQGLVKLINHYKTVRKINIGKTVVFESVTPGSDRFGWRKRFVVDGGKLYLVVRMEEKRFEIFSMKSRGKTSFYWDRVKGFGGDRVLFMARDCYFFLRASRKFPGREYKNCIVFSEAAFPQYGMDGWEFTEIDNVRRCEDDIAVFCLDDERFVQEGEGKKSGFPKIDWSPPDWILNASSLNADDFKKHSVSESSSGSEREPDEEEGSDSESGDTNGEEVQSRLKVSKSEDEEEQEAMESDLKDTESKDEEEQEEMESEFCRLDQDQRWVECDSDSRDQDDEKMQCDSKCQEKEDVEDVCHVSPSLFRPGSGNTVSRTLFSPTEKENFRKTIRELVLKACAASTTAALKSHKSDSATVKFEGFDIRLDSVSTLEKIWQKH